MTGAQAHGVAGTSGSSSRPTGFLGRWFDFGRGENEHGDSADALAAAAAPADEPCVVAVKVRHPEVDRQIFLDFQILKRAVRLVSNVPALRDLNLEETLGQFSHTMTAQNVFARKNLTSIPVDQLSESQIIQFKKNFYPAYTVNY